jgi:PGF-pre-PGF domain-containing protein
MKWPEFKIIFVLLLALTLCAIPASAGSAERTLPSSVNTDSEFQVKINVANYGEAGQVIEKLPEGFTFVSSTLPEGAVSVNGNKVSFLLINEKSFSYALKAPASAGTYKFEGILRDINKNELSIVPTASFINVKAPSSSGESSGGSSGGSSGSSGAGGSPEPQSNVEAKELSQEFVTNGTHVTFEFPKNATCIKYVEFDARKTLGKVTTIVEMLKGQSKLVSSLPEGTIYKNVNICVGTGGIANSDNIENSVVGFRVEKAWFEKNGADSAFLALWHYDKVWSKLETQKVSEDDTYMYFEAKTPGFGHFVIVESTDKKSSGSIDVKPITPVDSKSKLSSDSEKDPEESKSFLPGFESVAAIGVFGAVYCVLRRKF